MLWRSAARTPGGAGVRRGLLAWSEAEAPREALDARIARCQAAIADAGLGALLLYTNFPRPAAVSWLTHFVPYWSQGVLAVLPDGAPTLFVSLSKRVGGWIEETAHIAEAICTPRLGAEIAGFLGTRASGPVGVLELSRLPGGIAAPLAEGLGGAEMVDATALYRSVRHPADDAEILVTSRAAQMSRTAFAGLDAHERSAALVAAIDGRLRLEGAEEVLVFIAPDLDRDTTLLRADEDYALGRRRAVQISLAYKGHWIRETRTLVRGAPEHIGVDFETLGTEGDLDTLLRRALPGAELDDWTAEANVGSLPLSVVAASGIAAGAVITLTARYMGADGPVIGGAPLFP